MKPRKLQQQAETELRGLIATLRERGEERLPPLRALSSALSASPQTILRACRALERNGQLRSVPRQGIFIAGAAAQPELPDLSADMGLAPGRHRWERLKRRIETDLVSGTLTEEPFTIGFLMRRYQCAYQTVRKALGALVDARRFVECSGGYRRPGGEQRSGRLTVVLFLPKSPIELPIHSLDSVRRFALELERQCNRANLHLTVESWHYDDKTGKPVFPTLDSGGFSSPDAADRILAFVVFDRLFTPHTLDKLLTRLIRFRKPVAIAQTLHALHSGRIREYPEHVHWFDLTHSPLHGRTLAEFLIEQGHRKVAYVSLAHAAEWSLNRLSGLCRGFEPFGGASCVVPYVMQKTPRTEPPAREVYGHIAQKVIKAHTHGHAISDTTATHRDVSSDPDIIAKALLEFAEPLFRDCLAEADVTAWVAGNDATAVGLLAFLRKKRVKIPQRLSVVSFDNTYWSLSEEITSYDFDLEGLARAVLAYAVGYSRSIRRRQRGAPTVIPGLVIQRRSTARAG